MTCKPLFLLASLAISSIVLAQTPAPTPPAATPPAPQAAPAGRPSMRPGMRQDYMQQGGPGMQGHRRQANFRRSGMMHRGEGFRGGQGGFAGRGEGFHGPQGGGMGAGFHAGPSGMWWKNPGVVAKLTLTPDQTKKMDDIFQASRIQLIDLRANIEKANALLEPMLSANPVDTVKAGIQIDKVADARASLEKANAKMLLGIRGVLTPDQWTKLHTPGGVGGPGGPPTPGAAGQPAGAGGPGQGGGRRGPRGGGGGGGNAPAGGAQFVAPGADPYQP